MAHVATGMAFSGQRVCGLRARSIQCQPDLEGLSRIFADLPYPCILGGNPARFGPDRFSYWSAWPIARLEVKPGKHDALALLDQTLSSWRLSCNPEISLPKGIFCGGWMGFLSYDLARSIEQVRPHRLDDLGMPAIAIGLYDRLIAYDHLDCQAWLIALEIPGDEPASSKLDGLYRLLHKADICNSRPCGPQAMQEVRSNMSKAHYLDAVCQIKRRIVDGDVYQVNFSQRFDIPFYGRAIDLFCWQNRFNPSPYSAYLDWPPYQIVCTSPELFLRISDGWIETRPIKGTRPRLTGQDKASIEADQMGFVELISSEKEKAELAMIVDLERNDLARVCIPGTRYVPVERMIEVYQTVYHAVAVIKGRLSPDKGFADVLKATFPGGSVTGAPKLMAMEVIAGLEPTARGIYTGGIGYVGLDGNVSLNMAIRTAIIIDDMAFIQVGGGIVADSDPLAEYQETLSKARALLTWLGGV
ncbi:MAG: anthranilate synthase component I family protein [Sedimentisphaerales bacterium]|nr:anthranilate synthase component I family protein [Sedimentisphaerales bacterium]